LAEEIERRASTASGAAGVRPRSVLASKSCRDASKAGEHVEHERSSPLHQVDEYRSAALIEFYDLAIENGVVGVQFDRNL
jgi:hypothetical protein